MKRTFMQLIALVIFLGVGQFPAFAEQSTQPSSSEAVTAPQSTIDPASLAAAKQLIAITKSDQMMRQMLPTITKNFTAILTRDNPQKADIINKLVDQYYIPIFLSHLDEFQNQIAAIYAADLSLNDMQQLIAFYQTPTGQKYLQVMPAMVQQTMQLGMAWGQKVNHEATQQLIDQLKKNNMNVPKEIGL